MRKRVVALWALLLVLLLAFPAFAGRVFPDTMSPDEYYVGAWSTINKGNGSTDRNPDPVSLYKEILDAYFSQLKYGYHNSAYDLSYMAYPPYSKAPKGLEEIGYAFYDVDGDGIAELFIGFPGSAKEYWAFDLYTISNHSIKRLDEEGERSSIQLCTDGTISISGSGGASLEIFEYYTLQNGELNLYENAWQCFEGNTEYWLYRKGALLTDSQAREFRVTKQVGEGIVNSHTAQKLDFTYFKDYK